MGNTWTANYDMGKCPLCEEKVIGTLDAGQYLSVTHYCKNPRIDTKKLVKEESGNE